MDELITYGTITAYNMKIPTILGDITTNLDFFAAEFYGPDSKFQNIGSLSVNDTIIPFQKSDST